MPQKESFNKYFYCLCPQNALLSCLDAVCLFVVAAFILLETGLTLGNRWDSAACDKGLKLSKPDQLIVDYTGVHWGARSVSAEQPISKNKLGFFYYEVEILAHKGNSIAIGLGPTKPIPLQEEIGRVKGYAYNSGGIVLGHNVAGSFDFKGRPYIYEKPRFGVREVVGDDGVRNVVRDVVGCGVNLAKRQIFYTLNGALLGLTLGNRWDSVASDEGLKLSEPDQLTVEYPGLNYGAHSVSAEQPIPKIKWGIFYYEVEILARKAYCNEISIGLGHTKGIPRGNEIGRSEGYAYSDNGDVWGHDVKGADHLFDRPCIGGKPKFAVCKDVNGVVVVSRDVVGCGVNLKTGQIIYTLNGVLLDTTGMRVDLDADLFPTVSLGCPGFKIETNFGSKDFKFDIANAFR